MQLNVGESKIVGLSELLTAYANAKRRKILASSTTACHSAGLTRSPQA
jgi:hypothetical protein